MGFNIFPDSYCYFLRYLCHLSLGNIQRSNEEFSNMERVQFIGSEHDKMQHKVIMLNMKLIKNFKMMQTNTDWENRTCRFSDLPEYMSEDNFSEVDISNITNVLENLEMFGMDPNAMSTMLSNGCQLELYHFMNVFVPYNE